MKSVQGFTFEKLKKLGFQKIIPKFFTGTFWHFFLGKVSKDDVRSRASGASTGQVFSKENENESSNPHNKNLEKITA